MNELTIRFNEQDYVATYNEQTGYYELELAAPSTGGVYDVDINFLDVFGDLHEDSVSVQILAKEKIKIETNKLFMWVFDYKDFSVKDIVELQDYDIYIDEETNANSIINVLKKTTAKSRDIIVIKKNNNIIYWGTIDNVQNEDGELLYEFIAKYITNIFNQKIKLGNEEIIRTTGIEDFIASEITENFISNEDTFINKSWLEVVVKTHTPKQTSVTNVENEIYNLHTYMTNYTQNYDIVYSFSIVNKKLVITIENKALSKELIDVNAQAISNYSEVFETDVVSKVIVLYDKVNGEDSKGQYILYLRTDRTTTTDMTDQDRADGKVETIHTENYEDANQQALDVMKSNSYNHNITFNLFDKFIKVGTPIAIKTKESIILDTYISAVKITQKKFYEYTCGNIRIKFIDKLLKERRN
jgi:hypothetical protein